MQLMVTDQTRRRLLQAAFWGVALPLPTTFGCASVNADKKPALIGCAISGRDRYQVVIADHRGQPIAVHPLPKRGHGVAVQPNGTQAVAFARRPGDYFQPFDYESGEMKPLVVPEADRHFYGHGVYSKDGEYLFVTEGDKTTSRGIIGVYQVSNGYKKIDEWSGFGIGPHEVILLENNQLAIGVGGVHTLGRTPQNLESMMPSLSYLNMAGELVDQVGLPDHQLSIRHLATDANGAVYCGQQYRGEPDNYPSLVAVHSGLSSGGKGKSGLKMLNAEPEEWARFNHYIASIAVHENTLIATSPRGNCYGIWDLASNKLLELSALPDASGAVASEDGFWLSSGAAKVVHQAYDQPRQTLSSNIYWDNHWSVI
ncbi:DUF1513 domain-containing protein [Vibrio tapetis]|nr:DUF1513 domain-containing protein [Vibrio tapetis]